MLPAPPAAGAHEGAEQAHGHDDEELAYINKDESKMKSSKEQEEKAMPDFSARMFNADQYWNRIRREEQEE